MALIFEHQKGVLYAGFYGVSCSTTLLKTPRETQRLAQPRRTTRSPSSQKGGVIVLTWTCVGRATRSDCVCASSSWTSGASGSSGSSCRTSRCCGCATCGEEQGEHTHTQSHTHTSHTQRLWLHTHTHTHTNTHTHTQRGCETCGVEQGEHTHTHTHTPVEGGRVSEAVLRCLTQK